MNSDGKIVEPSIEEILASIRRIIADSAPSTPNKLSVAYAPPPLKAEARSDLDDAFVLPALFRSPHSPADQLPPQIGASNLDGHRIDWQQSPELRAHAREADATTGFSVLPLRTTEPASSEDVSQAVIGVREASSELPPPFPFSPPSANIPRRMVACKDTLLAGRMGQSRADVQSGIPLDDTPPQRMPGDSFGYGPIIPTEFRAPGAEPSAHITSVPKEPQGRTETASYGPIPEGLFGKTAVELLRPLLKEWLDNNMRSAFERALHVEVESAKTRQQ